MDAFDVITHIPTKTKRVIKFNSYINPQIWMLQKVNDKYEGELSITVPFNWYENRMESMILEI